LVQNIQIFSVFPYLKLTEIWKEHIVEKIIQIKTSQNNVMCIKKKKSNVMFFFKQLLLFKHT